MRAKENLTLVKSLYTLFNERKIDEAARLVAGSCTWTNVPTGQSYQGPAGFKEFAQGWLTAFPDAKVEIRNQIASDDSVVTEFIGRGTHDGPLQSPTGNIPATRRKIEISFVEVIKLDGGKVIESRAYFDAATMMRQLGLVESVGTR